MQLKSVFGFTRTEVESELVEVQLQGWPVWVHQKAAAAFRKVNQNLERIGYTIQEPVDGFNWREIEGHSVLSFHSFGIAVDINPSSNPSCGVTQTCHCYNDLITDMPPEFVSAFKDAGFDWGGDWEEHPDPMHFEWHGWQAELPTVE